MGNATEKAVGVTALKGIFFQNWYLLPLVMNSDNNWRRQTPRETSDAAARRLTPQRDV